MTQDEVHALVLSFPETEVSTYHGMPAYKAFGKFFTRVRSEDASVVLAEVPFEERDLLCEVDPETFHFTEHYRNYRYILARVSSVEPDQLKAMLMRRWRAIPTKTWLKAWDARQASSG
jgi:hypothetical protein